MITNETDELKKCNRKNINTVRKRAENIEVKKGRTAKIYTMNIVRKRLLKQRREKTLQNAKCKRLAEEYFLTALKASCKIHRALTLSILTAYHLYILCGFYVFAAISYNKTQDYKTSYLFKTTSVEGH